MKTHNNNNNRHQNIDIHTGALKNDNPRPNYVHIHDEKQVVLTSRVEFAESPTNYKTTPAGIERKREKRGRERERERQRDREITRKIMSHARKRSARKHARANRMVMDPSAQAQQANGAYASLRMNDIIEGMEDVALAR